MNNTTHPRIGFIGVGLMGHGMAKNILKGGYPLSVVAHRNREPIESLVQQGATEAKSVAELAQTADIIFLCVTGSPQVEALTLGPDGILKHAGEGTIVIDTTTASPASTRRINQQLREVGILFADSPLSRSPPKAETGELVSFIAAESPLFERVKPVLESYSEIVIHVGETIGGAHEIKLLNNFLATGYAAIWAEAYSACIASGNDPKVLYDVIVAGGGNDCPNFQNFSKFPLEGNEAAHKFTIANCAKDIEYFIRFADAMGHGTLVSDSVRQMFKLAVANGHGDSYMPAMLRFVREINGEPAA